MAKVVHLLRHAKSSWDDEGLADLDRPLARRGVEAGRALARYARKAGLAPDLVLCSPARRARETLDLVKEGLQPGTPVRVEDRIYRGGPTEILGILRALPADLTSAMVVGHNPVLRALTLALAGSGRQRARVLAKFPTGALAELTFPVGTWAELSRGGADLTSFVIPKELP